MFILSDKMYNGAKRLVQVILPAFAALYFGLAQIWGLPAAEEVVGTVAIVTTFLGVCLGISNKTYNALDAGNGGTIVISETTTEDGPKTIFSLEDVGDPDELLKRGTITFKVQKA